ncbi:flavin monoamine oxidase family protein [Kineococcus arenarius]|uniref:flavin monoamine oxidase family protein n=1 Tax=unclassified Kineococcus TaxID=2621656 RepID=UPI003D7D071D
MHDVIVVGAGPAGLQVAYQLREQGVSTLVLESGDEVGGRTRSVQLPGGAANTGALFVYRGTPTEDLVRELGIAVTPFRPRTYGIHLDGRTVVEQDDEQLVAALPLIPAERAELLACLRGAVEEYRAHTAGGEMTDQADALVGQTVEERFRTLSPRVRLVLETAVQGGSVGSTAQLSAKYALRYFASYVAREQDNRLLAVDGMQGICRRMAEALADGTVWLSTRVEGVEHDPATGTYRVRTSSRTGIGQLRARHVVLAVPAPVVPSLLPDLPSWKRAALRTAATPGSTTMVVAVDVRGLPRFKQWAFVTTVGRPFDCIINPAPGEQGFRDDPDVVHLVCYGNSAGHRPDLVADRTAIDGWVEEFLAVAPELRGRIRGVHVQTWEHCFAVLSPERAAVLEQLQQPVGRVHFAGDYTSVTAGSHGAFGEGLRVAGAIAADLGRDLRTPVLTG